MSGPKVICDRDFFSCVFVDCSLWVNEHLAGLHLISDSSLLLYCSCFGSCNTFKTHSSVYLQKVCNCGSYQHGHLRFWPIQQFSWETARFWKIIRIYLDKDKALNVCGKGCWVNRCCILLALQAGFSCGGT